MDSVPRPSKATRVLSFDEQVCCNERMQGTLDALLEGQTVLKLQLGLVLEKMGIEFNHSHDPNASTHRAPLLLPSLQISSANNNKDSQNNSNTNANNSPSILVAHATSEKHSTVVESISTGQLSRDSDLAAVDNPRGEWSKKQQSRRSTRTEAEAGMTRTTTVIPDSGLSSHLPATGLALSPGWPACLEKREFIAGDTEWNEDMESADSAEELVEKMTKFLRKRNDRLTQFCSSEVLKITDSIGGGGDRQIHPCVLDPNGRARIIFDQMSFLVMLYDIIILPIMLAWDIPIHGVWYWIVVFLTIFWGVDLLLNFRTGYLKDMKLISKPSAIARNYLRTWFALDVAALASNVYSLILERIEANEGSGVTSTSAIFLRIAKLGRIVRVMGVIRVLRIGKVLRALSDHYYGGHILIMWDVTGLTLVLAFINHLMGCTWFAISQYAPSDTGRTWASMSLGQSSPLTYEDMGMGYQYFTAAHWSLTQMTPGSMQVQPENSCERIYNIICLIIGMIFFSSIISQLSAKLMQYRSVRHDREEKLSQLSHWLGKHGIKPTLVVAARRQAQDRILRSEKPRPTDEVLLLLPEKAKIALFFETARPHFRHPILRWWTVAEQSLVQWGCHQCMSFKLVGDQDTVFHSNTVAVAAYVVVGGSFVYTQEPDTSKVFQRVSEEVYEEMLLSEAALWSHWSHVGSLEASALGELLIISSQDLARIVQVSPTATYIFQRYGAAFYARMVAARPPMQSYPTDLGITWGTFEEILPSLPRAARELVGYAALDVFVKEQGAAAAAGPSKWPKAARRHMEKADSFGSSVMAPASHPLEDEVKNGKCIVMVTAAGTVERFVSVHAVRMWRHDRRYLVHLAHIDPDGELEVDVKLPGTKQREGEIPEDTAKRLLKSWLRPFSEAVSMLEAQRFVTVKKVSKHGMKSTYMRTVHEARLAPDLNGVGVDDVFVPPSLRDGTSDYSWKDAFVLAKPELDQGDITLSREVRQPGTAAAASEGNDSAGPDLESGGVFFRYSVCAWVTESEFEELVSDTAKQNLADEFSQEPLENELLMQAAKNYRVTGPHAI